MPDSPKQPEPLQPLLPVSRWPANQRLLSQNQRVTLTIWQTVYVQLYFLGGHG